MNHANSINYKLKVGRRWRRNIKTHAKIINLLRTQQQQQCIHFHIHKKIVTEKKNFTHFRLYNKVSDALQTNINKNQSLPKVKERKNNRKKLTP